MITTIDDKLVLEHAPIKQVGFLKKFDKIVDLSVKESRK